jgi:hypothetical protein
MGSHCPYNSSRNAHSMDMVILFNKKYCHHYKMPKPHILRNKEHNKFQLYIQNLIIPGYWFLSMSSAVEMYQPNEWRSELTCDALILCANVSREAPP